MLLEHTLYNCTKFKSGIECKVFKSVHKFVRLKPKSAQNCKHNILEYFSSVSYSFTEKGSSKPGNFAELGEKSKQTNGEVS